MAWVGTAAVLAVVVPSGVPVVPEIWLMTLVLLATEVPADFAVVHQLEAHVDVFPHLFQIVLEVAQGRGVGDVRAEAG